MGHGGQRGHDWVLMIENDRPMPKNLKIFPGQPLRAKLAMPTIARLNYWMPPQNGSRLDPGRKNLVPRPSVSTSTTLTNQGIGAFKDVAFNGNQIDGAISRLKRTGF